ncbi:uncharacterized protein LOC117646728 isoform X1 [Thrips palmi]|uniref:Uncharacterized protein LOC117646728 isoform X1 n=1 Tax=Thrips palmi TaxID=161013 RepID=A0A6P8Z9P0_THRPL|nr:uncharacterized protein LOC117646728 isoform X1 [Thrips palmi]
MELSGESWGISAFPKSVPWKGQNQSKHTNKNQKSLLVPPGEQLRSTKYNTFLSSPFRNGKIFVWETLIGMVSVFCVTVLKPQSTRKGGKQAQEGVYLKII